MTEPYIAQAQHVCTSTHTHTQAHTFIQRCAHSDFFSPALMKCQTFPGQTVLCEFDIRWPSMICEHKRQSDGILLVCCVFFMAKKQYLMKSYDVHTAADIFFFAAVIPSLLSVCQSLTCEKLPNRKLNVFISARLNRFYV